MGNLNNTLAKTFFYSSVCSHFYIQTNMILVSKTVVITKVADPVVSIQLVLSANDL